MPARCHGRFAKTLVEGTTAPGSLGELFFVFWGYKKRRSLFLIGAVSPCGFVLLFFYCCLSTLLFSCLSGFVFLINFYCFPSLSFVAFRHWFLVEIAGTSFPEARARGILSYTTVSEEG